MAFDRQDTIVAESIGRIMVTLSDAPSGGGEDGSEPIRTAQFDIVVEMSTGHRRIRGNLVPHLTQAQIQALLDFMANLRTQAENQILQE